MKNENFEKQYNEIKNLRDVIRKTSFSHDDKCEDFIREVIESFDGCVDLWKELGYYVTFPEISIKKVYISENGNIRIVSIDNEEYSFLILTTNSLFELSSTLYRMLEKKQD